MKHMRKLAAVLAALLIVSLPASAQIQPGWTKSSYGSGTITTGGTAQTVTWLFNGPPNGYANLRCVQNPVAASEHLMVAFGATASATVGQDLAATAQVCAAWSASVSVWAPTTGHAYLTSEWQY